MSKEQEILYSLKNDIILILEGVDDTSILDWDSQRDAHTCNFCYGRSENGLLRKSKRGNAAAHEVKHTDDCPVTLARKILPLLKQTSEE